MSGAAADRAPRFLRGALYVASVLLLSSLLWLLLWVAAPAIGLGWKPVVIDGDSMTPLLRSGDVVLSAPRADGEPYGEGTIITYDDPAVDGRITTHRIDAVTREGAYVTRGDGNRQPDSTPVPPGNVRGAGRILVPKVGLPLVWWQRGQHVYVTLFLAALAGAALYATSYARPDSREGGVRGIDAPPEELRTRPVVSPRPGQVGTALAINATQEHRPK